MDHSQRSDNISDFERIDGGGSVVSNITFNSIETDVPEPNTKIKRSSGVAGDNKAGKKKKKKKKKKRGLFRRSLNEDEDESEMISNDAKTPLYRRSMNIRPPNSPSEKENDGLYVDHGAATAILIADDAAGTPRSTLVDDYSMFEYDSQTVASGDTATTVQRKLRTVVTAKGPKDLSEEEKETWKRKAQNYQALGDSSYQAGNYDEAFDCYYEFYLALLTLYGRGR